MARYDIDCIIILFFIYLDDLECKKLEEFTFEVILFVGPSFEKLGFETF